MSRLTKNNKGDYYYPECFERCGGLGTSEKAFATEQRKKNECIRKQKDALSNYLDMKQEVVERAKRRR
jgi:hypothetical protein